MLQACFFMGEIKKLNNILYETLKTFDSIYKVNVHFHVTTHIPIDITLIWTKITRCGIYCFKNFCLTV